MATGTVRVEIHPPGITPEHRSPLPLASATLTINGTTPTDPNALPTVASIAPGGFSGPCLAFITPLGMLSQSGGIWCSVAKVPDTTAEPRHLLGADNTGRIRTFIVDIGANDRIAFAGAA